MAQMPTTPDLTPAPGELFTTSEAERGNMQAILDAAREFADPVKFALTRESMPYAVALPDGRRLHSMKALFDEWRDKPERREGIAVLTTLEAFVAHARRFKDADSALFLDDTTPSRPRFISVLDYHREGPDGEGRFMRHRGVYEFPVSDEWKAWSGISGKPISQEAFADFLEDHLPDIHPTENPGEILTTFADTYGVRLGSPSSLLDVSKGLAINVEQNVMQHINASTGEVVFSFEERHKGKGGEDVKVPKAFGISIPVFRDGRKYQIPARLRYKVVNGKITFTIALHRIDIFFEHALLGALAKVAEDTQLPVFRGRPEAT